MLRCVEPGPSNVVVINLLNSATIVLRKRLGTKILSVLWFPFVFISVFPFTIAFTSLLTNIFTSPFLHLLPCASLAPIKVLFPPTIVKNLQAKKPSLASLFATKPPALHRPLRLTFNINSEYSEPLARSHNYSTTL
jgi:hypothetical protein